MTDAEVIAWLKRDGEKRCVLIEQDYMYQVGVGEEATPTLGTLRWSNFDYVDESTDPPRRYEACLKTAAEYARALNRAELRGQYNVDVGTTIINNAKGEFDYLLNLAIDGSEHRCYIGGLTWARSDFVHLYTAITVLARAKQKRFVEIVLRDPSLLLNRSIGSMVPVGGTGPSANKFRALNFGFIHQFKPDAIDTQNYAYNDTAANASVVAVRSNGVPFGGGDFTDNGDTTFTTTVPPTGDEEITCDVVVTKTSDPVSHRISDAFDYLVGDRGGLIASGRYQGAGAMFEYQWTNDYTVGIPILEKRNIIDICNNLCNTSNGFHAFTRLGQFYYSWMRPEALSFFVSGDWSGIDPVPISAYITKDDVRGEPAVDHNRPTYVSYQAYGNINWTDQNTFSPSLDANAKQQFERHGYITPAYYGEDPSSTSYTGTPPYRGGAPELYDLSLSDAQIADTLISAPEDTVESGTSDPYASYLSAADRQLQNWASVRRSQNLPWVEFIDITTGLVFYALELGDVVSFTFDRHDLNSGELLQVCSLRLKPMLATMDIGMVHRRFADVSGTPLVNDYLAKEDGDLILQENDDKIIVAASGGSGILELATLSGNALGTIDGDTLVTLNG